jgi:hypothetical protein
MKRRRAIGPKIQKNTGILIRYVLAAVGAATVGIVLMILLQKFIGPSATDEGKKSALQLIPGVVLAATIVAVLGLLFFGVRGYMMGVRSWHPFQRGRMKIKR